MQKPTATQKFHLSRLALFTVLAAALLLVRGSYGNAMQLTVDKRTVLAYATNMNIADLLSSANQSRAANGLTPLTLNAKLNSSAQMKANDMIANNYWAHVSPTGVQPWYWFNKVGYTYLAAGENLAYGFNTGAEVNTGWMNSPTHRENILGNYVDVGFGIANGPTYQGSENTVVVAHYGTLQPSAPAPAPAATTTPTAPTTPAAPAPTPVAPTPSPETTTTPAAPQTTAEQPEVTQPTNVTTPKTANVAAPISASENNVVVSVLDQLRNGKADLAVAVSIGLICLSSIGFIVTHRKFSRHLVENGKTFVVHHPLIDLAGLALSVGLILTTVVGHLL